MKFIYIAALLPFTAFADGESCGTYCVGVRGNGQAQAAHPTAIARMVEEFGTLPKMLSGGSSGTITQFLVEQVRASGKAASEKDSKRKAKIQALMLKSMPEFEASIAKDSKISQAFGIYSALNSKPTAPETIQEATKMLGGAGNLTKEELQAAVAKLGKLLNPEWINLVLQDPGKWGPEAAKSIENLGNFDALGDKSIFFRPGVVDFKSVAILMGVMGDFYAGNTDSETKSALNQFLDDCADSTFKKSWQDGPADCQSRFQQISGDYLKKGVFQNKALFEKVGAGSMPITAVLQGQGLDAYNKKKREYLQGNATGIEDFHVDFAKDLSVGYWGRSEQLDATKKGLEKFRAQGDFKAKHFRDLGDQTWFDVLSTSPAEPGLANAQQIPSGNTREKVLAEFAQTGGDRWKYLNYRPDVLSVGGWPDLQPTEVLAANPACPVTIYLTRHADYGDSKFAQQLAIRLAGEREKIPFFADIGKGGPGGWCDDAIREHKGDPSTVRETYWNKMFNLCDPQSSFRHSLDASDASYCTNWDAQENEVFDGKMWNLVKDAYNAPLFAISKKGMNCSLNNPPGNPDARAFPGCLPYPQRHIGSKPIPADEVEAHPAE